MRVPLAAAVDSRQDWLRASLDSRSRVVYSDGGYVLIFLVVVPRKMSEINASEAIHRLLANNKYETDNHTATCLAALFESDSMLRLCPSVHCVSAGLGRNN